MDTIFLEGTLELLASLLLVFLFIKFPLKLLKQNVKLFYIISTIISLSSLILGVLVFLDFIEVPLSLWWVRCIRSIVSGYLPAVIFMFVMYAGVLPVDNQLKPQLMINRSELSIIGTILYLPHTLIYSIFSAPRGITMLLKGDINIAYQLMTWTGLFNAILLIVLGLTSISAVRKKLSPSKWKKIQFFSYLFYFNCFSHYMTLSIWSEAYERAILYLVIYGVYLRLFILRSKNRNSSQSLTSLRI